MGIIPLRHNDRGKSVKLRNTSREKNGQLTIILDNFYKYDIYFHWVKHFLVETHKKIKANSLNNEYTIKNNTHVGVYPIKSIHSYKKCVFFA